MIEITYETLIDKSIVRETFESTKDIVVKVYGCAVFVYKKMEHENKLLGRLTRQREVY